MMYRRFSGWAVCVMDNLCHTTFFSLSELQLKSNLPTRMLKFLVDTQFISLPSWDIIEMFYLNSTLNFGIPPVLEFQLEVYYKVDRLLTGLTAQQ